MRKAARDDIWRRFAANQQRSHTIRSLRYENLPGFQTGSLNITSPITAICGANGAGKTSLLKAIWTALDWNTASGSKSNLMPLGAALLEVQAVENNNALNYQLNLAQPDNIVVPDHNLEVIHVDASAVASRLQRAFTEKEDINTLLNGVDPIPLTEDLSARISFLASKDYSEIRIFEIEEGGDIVPFFRVIEQGTEYDCRTMGLGEMCLLYIFWQLHRSNQNTVVLLEEPESFVSPIAQASLMDMIASLCNEKRLSIILTTHSPTIIRRIPPEGIRFLIRSPTGTRFSAPENNKEFALRHLGLRPENRTLLTVEDGISREFAKLWIARHDVDYMDRVEIVDVGGAGAITNCRKTYPSKAQLTRLVGVYDGDQRDLVEAGDSPFIFLPGHTSIEAMFRTRANVSTGLLAEQTNRTADVVEVSLAELAGSNDHDWLIELASKLRLTIEQIVMALFNVWVLDEGNATLSKAAFDTLVATLDH